jgi:hypothetical protein
MLQIEQRQKYAAWKAADIRKALQEGRKLTPGPPGGDEELSEMEGGIPWDTEVISSIFFISPGLTSYDPKVKNNIIKCKRDYFSDLILIL